MKKQIKWIQTPFSKNVATLHTWEAVVFHNCCVKRATSSLQPVLPSPMTPWACPELVDPHAFHTVINQPGDPLHTAFTLSFPHHNGHSSTAGSVSSLVTAIPRAFSKTTEWLHQVIYYLNGSHCMRLQTPKQQEPLLFPLCLSSTGQRAWHKTDTHKHFFNKSVNKGVRYIFLKY